MLHTKRRLNDAQLKHFDAPTPSYIGPQMSHPAFIDKFEDFSEDLQKEGYLKRANDWIQHWIKKGFEAKIEEILLSYIAFCTRNHQEDEPLTQEEKLTLLKELLERGFPKRTFQRVCVQVLNINDVITNELELLLPLDREIQAMIPYFLTACRQYQISMAPERMTVFVRDEAESKLLIGNNLKKCISDLDIQPLKFQIKKQHAIERYIYFNPSFKAAADSLATLAAAESWGDKNWILLNFIDQTYLRQKALNRIVNIGEHHLCCHINLINALAQPIFMILMKEPEEQPDIRFVEFCDSPKLCNFYLKEKLSISDLEKRFPRPTYFKDLVDIIFDPNLEMDTSMNTVHIFEDNEERIKKLLKVKEHRERAICEQWFTQQLTTQITAAKYNYRLPTPHLYKDEVQMLLPLYEDTPEGREVALVVAIQKSSDDNSKVVYKICTVLDPAWGYNNARVLGRIESNWLIESLAKTQKDEEN